MTKRVSIPSPTERETESVLTMILSDKEEDLLLDSDDSESSDKNVTVKINEIITQAQSSREWRTDVVCSKQSNGGKQKEEYLRSGEEEETESQGRIGDVSAELLESWGFKT